MKFLLILPVCILCGCSFLKFPGAPSNQPKKQYNSREYLRTRPEIIKITDAMTGRVLEFSIGNSIEHEFIINAEETVAKPSLWSKLMALGWLGIILGIASLFFPPLAIFLSMIGRGIECGAKKIVKTFDQAINSIEDEHIRNEILTTLSNIQDPETKLLVAKMKHKK